MRVFFRLFAPLFIRSSDPALRSFLVAIYYGEQRQFLLVLPLALPPSHPPTRFIGP